MESNVETVWHKSMAYQKHTWQAGAQTRIAYTFLGVAYQTKEAVEEAVTAYWRKTHLKEFRKRKVKL